MEAVLPRAAVHICTTPNYSGTWKGANVKLLIAAVKCKWCSAERVVIALGEEGHIRSAAPTSCSAVPWKDLCTDRAPLCERLKLRRQMLVSKKQHLKEDEGGIDTHVPKTSFKSYLSSTVGVLGFTTSSAFLLSGFFFPPKSGMMAAVVAVFSFAFFVFLLRLSGKFTACNYTLRSRRSSSVHCSRARPTLACDPGNLESRLPFTRSSRLLLHHLNPLLPWQTS